MADDDNDANTCTIIYSNPDDLQWLTAELSKTRENPAIRSALVKSAGTILYQSRDKVIFIVHQTKREPWNFFNSDEGGDELVAARAYIESIPPDRQADWTRNFYLVVVSHASPSSWNVDADAAAYWFDKKRTILEQIFNACHVVIFKQEETIEALGYLRM